MKANLRASEFFLVCLSFVLPFAVRPAQSRAQSGGAPAQADASPRSNIEIEKWTKPERGWLYVLDPKPEAGGPGGRIWLVDPETAKLMGSIHTGDHADLALSPDGSRLYIASVTDGDMSELAVIDTAAGTVVETTTVQDRALTGGLPPFSTMAVSRDGLALRILIDAPKSADADSFLLATLDTRTGDFLPKSVHLGNCGPGRFISHETADHFDVLCPRTNRVRLIRVDANSAELQNVDITLPWERRAGVAEAIEAPGAQDIAIIRGDGAVVKMALDTQGFADTSARRILPNRIPPAAWPTSPDGNKVYLGYNSSYDRSSDNRFYLDYGRPPNVRPDNAMADQFHVLDTRTWKKIGTIKTKMAFWSAVTANDGKTLYAMAPQKHSILVIDTEKVRQTHVLRVGGAPALAIVAP